MCKVFSIDLKKVTFGNYFAVILALAVCFSVLSENAKGSNYVQVPVKVNVLKGVNINDMCIKEIIKRANEGYLKQSGVMLGPEVRINRNVSDGGNEDGNIQESEEKKLDEQGTGELERLFGGKGVKVYIANDIYDDTQGSCTVVGAAPHITGAVGQGQQKPVIYLKNRPAASADEMGQVLAHEACHIFTLGKAMMIDDVNSSDPNGHVNNPKNLMNPRADPGAWLLTMAQRKEVMTGAKERAGKAKVREGSGGGGPGIRYKIETLPILQGLFVDEMNEPNIVRPSSDLGAGFFFAEDPCSNLEVSLLMEGTFEPDPNTDMVFRILFDTDNNTLTGSTVGQAIGVDKDVAAGLLGRQPGGLVIADLLDCLTGQRIIFLPSVSTQRIVKIIDKTDPNDPPETKDNVDMLYLEVPLGLLNVTANQVPVWVTCKNNLTGEFDEVGFTWQVFDLNAPVFELLTTRLEPRQSLEFAGRNFTPDSNVGIFLDDNLIGSTVAEPNGAIHGAILLDSSYYVFDVNERSYNFFFVTATDISGRSDFSIIELVPNLADIYPDTVVDFKDLAVLADNWLAGKEP